MRNLPQRIQLLANIAIIVIAFLLGGVLINRYVWRTTSKSESFRSEAPEDPRIKPGTKLSLAGVDWSKGNQTLLLVLSTNCHYCTESSPFYQRLAQQKAARQDLRTIALLPQAIDESQKYLRDHNVTVDEVRQSSLESVQARGTPTLVLVDKSGAVLSSWVGKLSAEKEAEVWPLLLDGRFERMMTLALTE